MSILTHGLLALTVFTVLPFARAAAAMAADSDPYISLEVANDPAAVTWADQETKKTLAKLQSDPRYAPLVDQLRTIVGSPNRLPSITMHDGWAETLWQDQTHPHGQWRRFRLEDLKAGRTTGETLLDLDDLSAREQTNWVWREASCIEPERSRCLIWLSPGGGDASVVREYDRLKHEFVANGFSIPAAKTVGTWLDADTLLIATDFGAGSLSKAGYPRFVKKWKRGEPLSQATTVLEATPDQLGVDATSTLTTRGPIVTIARNFDFYNGQSYKYLDGKLVLMPFPPSADISIGPDGRSFAVLKKPWTVNGRKFTAGSLVTLGEDAPANATPDLIFAPSEKVSLLAHQEAGSTVYLSLMNEVRAQLLRATPTSTGWQLTEVKLPGIGSLSVAPSDRMDTDLVFTFETFLAPRTIYRLPAGSSEFERIAQAPAVFDAAGFVTEQFEAVSPDGTSVPYFVVHAASLPYDGSTPTIEYGYGGFEVSMTPSYLSSEGKAWLEKGGAWVVANIRGGGEFGPAWHTAAIGVHRQRAYDDFIAVAQDLIARKITSPPHLGIEGGSNGGLLVGAVFVERPDLFNAVACEVPLLDMIRYPLIGAGYSWEAEYGDPSEPTFRDAILRYSPYQNVKPGVHYPHPFFLTSRTDDRVGPAHARKMAAKMQAYGDDVLFFEDAEGGHTGGDNPEEEIRTMALTTTYFYQQLLPKK